MSRLGKIVLEGNRGNPKIIIAEEGKFLNAIELVKSANPYSSIEIPQEDIIKVNYNGKKLDDCKADFNNISIHNLQIKEIGSLTEEGYYRLLRKYVNYQSAMGGTNSSYRMVRNEVHNQLIKRMEK